MLPYADATPRSPPTILPRFTFCQTDHWERKPEHYPGLPPEFGRQAMSRRPGLPSTSAAHHPPIRPRFYERFAVCLTLPFWPPLPKERLGVTCKKHGRIHPKHRHAAT